MFNKPGVVSHFRVRIEKRQENRSPYFSVVERAWIDRQIDRHFIQLLPADCHLVAFFFFSLQLFSLFPYSFPLSQTGREANFYSDYLSFSSFIHIYKYVCVS